MTLFSHVIKIYAAFYDSSGRFVGKKRIDPDDVTFNFQKKSYVYRSNCNSYTKFERFVFVHKIYHYNIDNPEPLEFQDKFKPILTARDFGTMINSKKLEELNSLANEGGLLNTLLALLKSPIFWIILVAFIGIFIYLAKHGWKLG